MNGMTPDQLEAMAAQMRQGPPQAPPRMRFRLFSAPIPEAAALGEEVDAALVEAQDRGDRCQQPGVWVEGGHVLVAVSVAEALPD